MSLYLSLSLNGLPWSEWSSWSYELRGVWNRKCRKCGICVEQRLQLDTLFSLEITPKTWFSDFYFFNFLRQTQIRSRCVSLGNYFILCDDWDGCYCHWSRNLIPPQSKGETGDTVHSLSTITDHWDSLMTHTTHTDMHFVHAAQEQTQIHTEKVTSFRHQMPHWVIVFLLQGRWIEEPITSFALQGKPAVRAFTARLLRGTPGSLI